jgi:bifunctional enzyme CysN/CysC
VARILADAGLLAVVALISPYRSDRLTVRELHDAAGLPFLEIYLDTPLVECERRDPRGLYARARRGEITGVTGIDDPYEPPESPELVLHPDRESVGEAAARVVELVSRSDLSRALRRAAPAPLPLTALD